jgi:aminoglycoside phosphotransferase (APT) family kinase protein
MKSNTNHNFHLPIMPAYCGTFDVRGYEWYIMKFMEGQT